MYEDVKTDFSIRYFFNDPFANGYSRYCSEKVSAAVAQINAAFEYAMELVPASKRRNMEEIVDAVSKQTNQLLRAAAISRTLSDTHPESETVDVDALIAFLCEQFTKRLGGRITFRLRSLCRAFVRSDSRIIAELLLGAVRKMALNCTAEKPEFFIGADVVGKNVRIYISDSHFDGDVNDPLKKKEPADEEFFDRYFGYVNTLVAELIGASGGYGSGLYTLEFPELDTDDAFELRSPVTYDTWDWIYTCDIMLNDDKL